MAEVVRQSSYSPHTVVIQSSYSSYTSVIRLWGLGEIEIMALG